jgi:hypothetical protein
MVRGRTVVMGWVSNWNSTSRSDFALRKFVQVSGVPNMNRCVITRADLLTVIEDVGFGKAIVGGADRNGIVVDGYLDLTRIAERLNRIYELRNRARQLACDQPR